MSIESPTKSLIGEIFQTCRARLARIVSRIVPPQDIEDIVQETYVKVCEYVTQNQVSEPRALMLTVARNLALDHVKRAEYRLTRGIDGEIDIESILSRDATDQSFAEASANQEFARFCDAVRQLPVQARRAFILKKVYGFSQREIALELNISESTVEKHIANGLRQCLLYMRAHASPGPAAAVDQGRVAASRGAAR